MYRLEFKIDSLPKPVNAWRSKHWTLRMKEDAKWKALVELAVRDRKPPTPLQTACLWLSRYSSVAPDYDGLVSSFKPVIDGLVEAEILEDDSLEHIGMPHFSWFKVLPKKGFIDVIVEGKID